MPASILKQCVGIYIDPLTYLINLSINQGIFPSELNIAKVIPIYKSDDKQLIRNYRQISVLPYFSKMCEKIISNHLLNFIESNNILYDNQFGFRKNHSTTLYKNMLNILPKFISMMFKKNNEIHNYNTRRGNSLHTSVGKHDNMYKCLSFHAIKIWNYMIRYIPINTPFYTRFKRLTKVYIQNNDIKYRMSY